MYKEFENKIYVETGDSITWTVAKTVKGALITRKMRDDIGFVKFINKGVGGTDSSRLLAVFKEYVLRVDFDFISIGVGMNDSANLKVPVATFSANLTEMVRLIKRNRPKAEILLFAPPTAIEPSRVGNLASYRTAMSAVATAEGTLYYDPSTLWTTSYDDSYLYTRQFSSGNRYKLLGTWNANTNVATNTATGLTSALANGTGDLGDYYRVTTLGTTTLDGISSWAVDDAVVFNGTVWKKATPNWALVSPIQNYRGTWNANTNSTTPLVGSPAAIVSATGTLGDWYRVATAGSTTIDGVNSWAVNDALIFNGTAWVKESIDWIHPIQEGHDLIATNEYAYIQTNSKFYALGL